MHTTRHRLLGLLVLVLTAAPLTAQLPRAADSAAVRELAARYARGFYLNSPDSVLATTHLELSKKGVEGRFWGSAHEFLQWLEGDRLRLAGGLHDTPDRFDASTPLRVRVHALTPRVASVDMVAANWYDTMTLVRLGGTWRILDIVWGGVPEYEEPEVDAGEAGEFRSLMAGFLTGTTAADSAVLDSIVHPNLRMRGWERREGREVVVPVTREQLRLGLHDFRPVGDEVALAVHNVTRRTAGGVATSDQMRYWIQALRIDGRWWIVNVTVETLG